MMSYSRGLEMVHTKDYMENNKKIIDATTPNKKECVGCINKVHTLEPGKRYIECLFGYSMKEGTQKCNRQEYEEER